MLKDQFLSPLWDLISQQPVPNASTNNFWIGTGANSGKFKFKLLQSSVPPYLFVDMIWFHYHSPKMYVCLLSAIHSKFLTRDFLKSIGIIDTDVCILSCRTRKHSTLVF